MEKNNQAYVQENTTDQSDINTVPVVSHHRHVQFNIDPSNCATSANRSDRLSSVGASAIVVLDTYHIPNLQQNKYFKIKNPKKCAVTVVIVLMVITVFVVIPIIISLNL